MADEAGRKAVEAAAYCGSIACLNLRDKTVALRGFNAELDGEPIGLCNRCYTRVQMAFVNGTATTELAMMLGAVAEPREGGQE